MMGHAGSMQSQANLVKEVSKEEDLQDIPQDWYMNSINIDISENQQSLAEDTEIDNMAEAFLAEHDVAEMEPDTAEEVSIPLGVKKSSLSSPNLNNSKNLADILTGNYNEEDGELSWQIDALCAQTDPEAFFPEKGGSTRDAKKVCTACTVRTQCLEYALSNDERFGIWGGLSERERRRIRKRAI